jgi:hypothetical protein
MSIPVNRRQHYSRDIKDLVMYQCHTLLRNTSQISTDLNVPWCVVQCILQIYEEIGESVRDPLTYSNSGRSPLLNSESVEVFNVSFISLWSTYCLELQFVLALLEQQPDLYLDEIAEKIWECLNKNVLLSTIQKTLKFLGISSKKVCNVVIFSLVQWLIVAWTAFQSGH